jgi:hypothetical protein
MKPLEETSLLVRREIRIQVRRSLRHSKKIRHKFNDTIDLQTWQQIGIKVLPVSGGIADLLESLMEEEMKLS